MNKISTEIIDNFILDFDTSFIPTKGDEIFLNYIIGKERLSSSEMIEVIKTCSYREVRNHMKQQYEYYYARGIPCIWTND